MNLAITMTAWRRPEYTLRALRAVNNVDQESSLPLYGLVDRFEEQPFDSDRTFSVGESTTGFWDQAAQHIGLWGKRNVQYLLYEKAFAAKTTDAILAIEDDCILAPDSISLCHWFLSLPNCSDFLFLSLANCNRAETTNGRELEIVESVRLDSPWSWCFTRAAWQQIKPEWQRKTQKPTGWDWSLTYSMAIHKWKALNPVLPRAKNIGRDFGANGGAGIFDETLALAAVSDGTWGNEYRIVRRNDNPLIWGESWMREEAEGDGIWNAIKPGM
jgi:hypothetical protein